MTQKSRLTKVGHWLFWPPLVSGFLIGLFAVGEAVLYGHGGPGPRGDFLLPCMVLAIYLAMPGFVVLGVSLVRDCPSR